MNNLNVSSWNPQPGEVFSYPYIISKDYYRANLFGADFNFEDDLDQSIGELRALFDTIIAKERAKEQAFISAYLSIIQTKDPSFYQQLYSIFANKGGMSNLINIIQKYRMGLLDLHNSLQEALKNFDENWSYFYNKAFLDILDRADLTPSLDMTIDDYFNNLETVIKEEYSDKVTNMTPEDYNRFLNGMFYSMKEMANTKFGDDYQKALKSLSDNRYIKTKQKEHLKKDKSTKIEDIIKGYVFGILNGLSAERFLITFGGASGTGRILQNFSTLTGSGGGAVAIKTDVLEIINSVFEIYPGDQKDFIDKCGESNEELYKYLEKIDPDIAFAIHTSVKDQSTNKNYTNGRSMQVDITKSGSLDTRLGPIKEIGDVIGGGIRKDIQNLIFAIANAGAYMVASNMKGQILTGLTSLCAAYMFEDYAETFAQFNSETSNKQLHLYFISGKYYTISDILTLARNSLKPSGQNTYVKISFTPTKANEFKADEVANLHGQSKWEAVRTNTLKNGSMSIRLNTRALLNAIYPEGF